MAALNLSYWWEGLARLSLAGEAAKTSEAITLGLLSGRVVVIAHTETGEVIRIISVRKATKNEKARYFKEVSD
jgi:uncharacterized DUF497 family protein